MADDITLNGGSGGDTVAALDDGTRKWPVGVVAYPTTLGTPDVLRIVDLANGLPVVFQTGYTPGYNLSQYGGVAVGAANALHVQPGTGAVFAISDGGGSITIDGNVGVVGAVEIANDAGNPIPVSGTFWQATQPVSIAATVPVDTELPAAAALADAAANPTAPAVGAFNLAWNGATWDRLPGDTAGAFAQGNVAHGSVDAGNPVKIGLKANSLAPANVHAGDRVDGWGSLSGGFVVHPAMTGSAWAADGQSANPNTWTDPSGAQRILAVHAAQFNGTNYDRLRNNHEVTALASAARTANVNSADLTNFNARGVAVVIDITAGGGAGSLTVKLTGKDTLSGKYVTLFSTGALAAPGVSTYSFQVFPGATPVAQVSGTPATVGKADFLVPRTFRVEVTTGDATSYTYSVGVNFLP